MRVFHVLAYDGNASSTQAVYSYPALSNLFGTVDLLDVGGYACQVSGTPTLTIQEEISLDGENWTLGNLVVNNASLTVGQDNLFQGADFDSDVNLFGAKPAFVRLKIALGSSGSAIVRAWVTGRDRSRRAHSIAQPIAPVPVRPSHV